ncbi:MAG: DNA internalization-related competence protein ComEC/Rec2 [Gammaproteobacteria bacterium]
MAFSALSFLTGIVIVQQLSDLPGMAWLAAISILAVVAVRHKYWRCLFFLLGGLWAIVHATAILSQRLPRPLEGENLNVRGYVADLPKQDEKGTRFVFIITESKQNVRGKIRLSWFQPDRPVKAGQYWSFTVKLKRPHGNVNPGGFDYERWLFMQGITATGYVRSSPKPELLAIDPPWHRIAPRRQQLSDRLSILLPETSGLGLIKALSIGDGSGIAQKQWDLFRATGTTHLMIISGTHIGLVAGFIYFLTLKLWAYPGILRWPPPKAAAVSGMAAAFFYSAMAGFSVPTQRALVMVSVVMSAVILQRNNRPLHTLSVALFVVLFFDPLAVLSPGFWLSFLAVGLILFCVSGRLGKTGFLLGTFKLNGVTALGLSPLLLLIFQQIPLFAPLANLIAVPIISLFVVPLTLLAVATLTVSPFFARLLFIPVDRILQIYEALLTRIADLPASSINYGHASLWQLLFALPAILIALAPAGTPSRWLSLVLFLPIVFTDTNTPQTGRFTLTLLDVGQGLAAAVQTADHWLIFDTGAKFSPDFDMGQNVILPFLRSRGADHIDNLIVSHGDNDHAGGAQSLLDGIPVKQLTTSVPDQFGGHTPIACSAGQQWEWDEVRFTLLSPGAVPFDGDNDNSCVLKIDSDRGSALLSGDIEAIAENRLVGIYGKELKADVLIAPHHGSKTSSTTAFLEAVRPDYILIPAGYRNQFGHPHRDVLARYRQIHAKWLNSADSGAIEVVFKDKTPEVQILRQKDKKYWRDH